MSRSGPAVTARALVTLAGAVASAAVFWQLRPAAPSSTALPVTDVVRGCAWLAWALGGYLAVTVAVVSLAHLVAMVGPAGRGLTHLRRLAPRRLRRFLDLAITAGLTATVIGSAGATVASAATPAAYAHSVPAGRPVPVGAPLEWPGLAAAPAAEHPVASATPTPAPAPGPQPTTRPHHHAEVGLVTGGSAGGSADRSAEVVVRGGDTLWSIASRHLGPQASAAEVTSAWHQWYAANRSVIGPDPGRIFPGQRLQPPAVQSPTTHEARSPR